MTKQTLITLCFALLLPSTALYADKLTVSYLERPPYYYTEQGEARGFLLDLQRNILKKAGIEARYVSLPAKRILRAIKDANGQHCSVGWFKKPERERFAKFSLPIYQNQPLVLLANRHNGAKLQAHHNLSEIFSDRSLSLGTISGFSYGTAVDQLIKERSPATLTITGEQQQLFKMLVSGRYSYLFIAPEEVDDLIASMALRREDFTTVQLAELPIGNKRYLMCGKDVDDALIERINQTILTVVDPPIAE